MKVDAEGRRSLRMHFFQVLAWLQSSGKLNSLFEGDDADFCNKFSKLAPASRAKQVSKLAAALLDRSFIYRGSAKPVEN
jgi:hypothetical protein